MCMAIVRSQPIKDVQLSVGQVANCLGVTSETVRRYIRESKLKATKIARQGLKTEWCVFKSDLLDFSKGRGLSIDLSRLAAQ